ncbi:hypothetical protein LQZ18_01655 [Lachnospiraceae bacterium ZAX-1]
MAVAIPPTLIKINRRNGVDKIGWQKKEDGETNGQPEDCQPAFANIAERGRSDTELRRIFKHPKNGCYYKGH